MGILWLWALQTLWWGWEYSVGEEKGLVYSLSPTPRWGNNERSPEILVVSFVSRCQRQPRPGAGWMG